LLGELKARYGCATLAVTGHAPPAARVGGAPGGGGVDAFIVKPVDVTRLRSAVGGLCDRRPPPPA
jgi:hypothetical protein